ncbi:hypothetical protein MIH18_23240 (plasmid) [Marinobacter sp. M3C]|nr:hypothetical protein MIH18_23205 [Marinobacter sp. M3C]UQG62639.1 hypothetical protein MIH18_23240 [Marinobacter sp. M3C]
MSMVAYRAVGQFRYCSGSNLDKDYYRSEVVLNSLLLIPALTLAECGADFAAYAKIVEPLATACAHGTLW